MNNIERSMTIDFRTPQMILELLLNQIDSGRGIPAVFQVGDVLPDWEIVSATNQLNLDELETFQHEGESLFSSALIGHGFMSNFFHFDFFSPRLKVAVAFPYGNAVADETARKEHSQNVRGIIASLYLLFNAFQENKAAFLPEKGMLLATCQNFKTAFRVKDSAGVIREEQSWQGLLDLLSEATEPQDSVFRIYV